MVCDPEVFPCIVNGTRDDSEGYFMTITRLHVGHTAKFAFFFYLMTMGIIVLPVLLMMVVFSVAFSSESTFASQPPMSIIAGMGLVMVLIMVPVYAAFGASIVAISTWIYNVVAKKVGGIRIDVK